MAEHDILLTQNIHASLVEYEDKFVNIAKGDILSAIDDQTPTVLAGGTDGYVLVRDDIEVTGLKWVDHSSLNNIIVTNQANDRIVTATAVTDTLNAEEFLTYNVTQGLGINAGLGIVFAAAVTTYRIYTPDSIYRTSLEIISGDNSAGAAGDVTIQAGSGTSSGGNVYFNRDTTYGDFFFGTGAAGHLPAMSAEADVVFYDSTTGKLSYGVATGIYTFGSGLTETAGNVVLGGDAAATSLNMSGSFNLQSSYVATSGSTKMVQGYNYSYFVNYRSDTYGSGAGGSAWVGVQKGSGAAYEQAYMSVSHPTAGYKRIELDQLSISVEDSIHSKGMVYSADYSTAGEADDRWIPDWGAVKGYADGAGVSFGLNNHIPVTNQQVNDFDYTNEFTFTQGSGLTVMNSIQLVSTGWGPGCKILTETTGELTNVHTSVYNGSGYDIIWVGGWSQGSTGAHTGGNVTIKGGEQTGVLAGDGGSVYIYGGPSAAADRGSVYFGDGSSIATLQARSTEDQVVYYDTTTGLLTYGDGAGLSGPYTFGSGLTETAGNVVLGGALTETTYIEVGTRVLLIYGSDTDTSSRFQQGDSYINWETTNDTWQGGGATIAHYVKCYQDEASLSSVDIGSGSPFPRRELRLTPTEAIFEDSWGDKGLVYADDYSTAGTLDDRWIPDYGAVKAYADSVGGSVSFGTAQYQIPVTNSTTDDFDYNAGFTYNAATYSFNAGTYNQGISNISGMQITGGASNLAISKTNPSVASILVHGGAGDATYDAGNMSVRGGYSGDTTRPNGGHLYVYGGPAFGSSGDGDGGNVYIFGGTGQGTGSTGSVYFGTGLAALLPNDEVEANLLAYDTATGLVSYRSVASLAGLGTNPFFVGDDTVVRASAYEATINVSATGTAENASVEIVGSTSSGIVGRISFHNALATGATNEVIAAIQVDRSSSNDEGKIKILSSDWGGVLDTVWEYNTAGHTWSDAGTEVLRLSGFAIQPLSGSINVGQNADPFDEVHCNSMHVNDSINNTLISAALTDGAPTDAEIDTATGTTPAAAGAGYEVKILDTSGTALIYIVISDGTNWQYTPLTIAT